ncbi:MAG: hypothetical protein Q9174_003727, partial [Haloplaca sp. 1 TL-2023]
MTKRSTTGTLSLGRCWYIHLFPLPTGFLRLLTAPQALARDLSLSTTDYIHTITTPETPPDDDNDDNDTLPSSPSEIPHSRPGCLYLLSATLASSTLFHAPSTLNTLDLPLFPTYASILNNLLAASPSIGTESPALIDALLFLGLHILETEGLGRPPEEDMVFTDTLRHLSLLSANTPAPTLRYHAHVLTSRLLHAHPEGNVRLAFIKDTLEHCPYENLKGSAVGWLKEEIRISNAPSVDPSAEKEAKTKDDSVFRRPICLDTLSRELFMSPKRMDHQTFEQHISFFMDVLNLVYFLLATDG